jgi:hypothetical protein
MCRQMKVCRQMKGGKSGDGLLAGKRSEQTRWVNVVNDSSSREAFSGRAAKMTALLSYLPLDDRNGQ